MQKFVPYALREYIIVLSKSREEQDQTNGKEDEKRAVPAVAFWAGFDIIKGEEKIYEEKTDITCFSVVMPV